MKVLLFGQMGGGGGGAGGGGGGGGGGEIGKAEAEKTLVYCLYAGYFNCDYDMLILRK